MRPSFAALLLAAAASANPAADRLAAKLERQTQARLDALVSGDTWMSFPTGWKLVAAQVLALRTDPPEVPLAAAELDGYVGVYRLTPEITYEIRREGDHLVGERKGRAAAPLKAEARDVFFVPGDNRIRKIFQRGADGRVTGFVERRESWDIHWKRAAAGR